MKKFQKLVALLLVLVMVLSLAACEKTTQKKTTEYDIKVWVPEKAVELTKKQIDNFNAENTFGIKFNASIEAVGEGDAATSMTQDVEAGADIFFFAQDQLVRLIQAAAVAQLGEKATAFVKDNNSDDAAKAASSGLNYYCYPLTADNGYYLYYDKSVLTADDVKTLDGIIAKCKSADKFFSFELEGSAWYTAAFFFATGCVSDWTINEKGEFVSCNDTFNSPEGVIALKGMKTLLTSGIYNNKSSVGEFANGSAAVVSGPWDAKDAQKLLGENYAATKLPTFTVDGKEYQLGSFTGSKLLGVKPTNNVERAAALAQLAQYLTGEKCQLERYTELGWGPSNKTAQASEAVQNDVALKALWAQAPYAKVQGQIPGVYWDNAKTIASEAKETTDDDGLKAALENYKKKVDSFISISPEQRAAFTVIGAVAGSMWDKDFEMVNEGNVWTTKEAFDLAAGTEFKVRQGLSWNVAYGATPGVSDNAPNFVVETAGKYKIQLDVSTGTVSLIAE